MPKPVTTPQPSHPSATPAERGNYLVTIAGCQGCHTPADDKGNPLPGLAFGGGALFTDPVPGGKPVFTVNITQDPSGIAHYDEAMLMETLRTGRIKGRMLNHIMPFEWFRNMTDDDIRDIYAFLKSVPPVKHRVSNTDEPTPCPLCKQTHGLGDLNKQ
jgi:cytochrome c553